MTGQPSHALHELYGEEERPAGQTGRGDTGRVSLRPAPSRAMRRLRGAAPLALVAAVAVALIVKSVVAAGGGGSGSPAAGTASGPFPPSRARPSLSPQRGHDSKSRPPSTSVGRRAAPRPLSRAARSLRGRQGPLQMPSTHRPAASVPVETAAPSGWDRPPRLAAGGSPEEFGFER
jgi:hypothetical protein